MFDIGWTELAIVALIALLVIGPKELPATMRMIAGWIGKIRSLAREFQGGLDDMMRETELDKLKEQAQGVMHGDLDGMVENTIDPDGSVRDTLDYGDTYEPFGDFDDPEPEIKPAKTEKKKDAAKPQAAAAATAGNAKAPAKRKRAAGAPAKTTAKTAARTATKAPAKSAAKTAPKSRARSTAKTAAKPAPKSTGKTSSAPAADKPAPAGDAKSDG